MTPEFDADDLEYQQSTRSAGGSHLDFNPERDPYLDSGDGRRWRTVVVVVVLLLAAAAGYWFFASKPAPKPASAPVATAKPAPVPTGPAPLCASADAPAGVASLNNSDAAVAPLVRALSANPRVAAWAMTPNLIRTFVVAVENISNGSTPITPLRALKPAGPFRVVEAREETRIDPRSFDRYNVIGAAVDSVNPQATARLCTSLKPRLEEAYKELGREGTFDVTLERAIVKLLDTPSLGANEALVPKGALWAFEDEDLEKLTPPQKQLARMGPRNERIVQEKLRQIAMAIGIPADRLPAESIR